MPVNIVKPIVNRLITDGKFEEAWLGIYGYDKEAIPYLDANIQIESGIYVAQVALDGPLANQDIKEGDIITKIDHTVISKMNDLKKYVYNKSPGDTVTLHMKRAGQSFTKQITLANK